MHEHFGENLKIHTQNVFLFEFFLNFTQCDESRNVDRVDLIYFILNEKISFHIDFTKYWYTHFSSVYSCFFNNNRLHTFRY